MKYSHKKGLVSRAYYWKLVSRETARIVGRPFRMEYIRDVAGGQRDAPAIKFYLRLAMDSVEAKLKDQGMKIVDARKAVNK
jgi:hypothetical protein